MDIQKLKVFLAIVCLPLGLLFLVGMIIKIKNEFSNMTRDDHFYAILIMGFIAFSIAISLFELMRLLQKKK